MSARAAAMLTMMGASLLGAPESVIGTESVVVDFETNSLSGVNVSGNAPTVQSSIRRHGRYAMRSDLDRYASRDPYRTEARVVASPPLVNKVYWYGFSIYLPDDHVPDATRDILIQWHAIPDGGESHSNPPMALETIQGVWRLRNRWTADPVTTKSNVMSRTFTFGKHARGRWTDWVFRVRWSYGAKGIVEAWKDGIKVLSATGPNTYNDTRMPFFKMGVYRGWNDGPITHRTVYHDEVRRVGPGGSYSDVAPPASRTTLEAPSQFTVD
jgi:Polysaccharide lyase